MNNHHHSSTNDFRYLNMFAPCDRAQIERGLEDMGTDQDVIYWFFTQVDDLKAEYTKQLHEACNTLIQ